MLELVLIRHADPDYANDTITKLGHRQAKALATHLRRCGVTFDGLFASHFGRAQATMRYTAEAYGLTGAICPWLGEPDGRVPDGRWSWSMPRPEHLEKGIPLDAKNWHRHVPYGKSLRAIQAERLAAFNAFLVDYGLFPDGLRYRVKKGTRDQRLALFAHEGFFKILLSGLLHWPLPYVLAHLTYEPTGVTRLVFEEHEGFATPRAVTINDRSHLKEALR
jgi:probable phosphoglycerate mutase